MGVTKDEFLDMTPGQTMTMINIYYSIYFKKDKKDKEKEEKQNKKNNNKDDITVETRDDFKNFFNIK